MSLPALRQPKAVAKTQKPVRNNGLPKERLRITELQNLIVTLKEGTKLVVTTDAYNGIITEGDIYKCVFCAAEMDREVTLKELHVKSQKHMKATERFQFLDEYPEHMIRQINVDTFYCTVCNVLVSQHYITRHVNNNVHKEELSKAVKKTLVYKPVV